MFEMRIAGPDDVYQFDDELAALREANEINKAYVNYCAQNPITKERTFRILLVATVHEVE